MSVGLSWISLDSLGDIILRVVKSFAGGIMTAPSRPSDRVVEMFSGIPSRLRFRRFVVVLQAVIDDSGRGQGPVFILAGWIADPGKWVNFSGAWDTVLHAPPRIEYFKMGDAWSFKKEFCGWTREARDKKVADLYKVIEDHVMYGINVVVPRELYFSYSRQVSPRKIK